MTRRRSREAAVDKSLLPYSPPPLHSCTYYLEIGFVLSGRWILLDFVMLCPIMRRSKWRKGKERENKIKVPASASRFPLLHVSLL